MWRWLPYCKKALSRVASSWLHNVIFFRRQPKLGTNHQSWESTCRRSKMQRDHKWHWRKFQYFFRGKDDSDIAYQRKTWAKTSKKRTWFKAKWSSYKLSSYKSYLPITFQHPKNINISEETQQKSTTNNKKIIFRFSLTLLWILVPFKGSHRSRFRQPVPPVPVTPPPRAVRWSRWRARRAVNNSTRGAPETKDFRIFHGVFMGFSRDLASLSIT